MHLKLVLVRLRLENRSFPVLLAITHHNGTAKKCWKKQTVYRILKIGLPLLVVFF